MKILKEMGIPDHLTCLLRNLYAGQEATVRTGHGSKERPLQSTLAGGRGEGALAAQASSALSLGAHSLMPRGLLAFSAV